MNYNSVENVKHNKLDLIPCAFMCVIDLEIHRSQRGGDDKINIRGHE